MAHNIRRGVVAGLLAAAATMSTTAVASAETITQQFRGEGNSSFGFAFDYARAHAWVKAEKAGFAPLDQCAEIWKWGNAFDAVVVWECTREL